MRIKIVPDVIGKQNFRLVKADIRLREAGKLMATHKIGAVMVGDETNLIGIFTERDLAFKVVAMGRDPEGIRLSEVMTRDPDTLRPEDTAHDSLQRMSQRGYRHLPVVAYSGRLVGMVSIRDFYAVVLR